MSRSIKDETQMTQTNQEQAAPAEPQQNPLQIEIDELMQKKLVMIIEDDYDKFKQVRDSKEYGKTDKGDTLSFEKWFTQLQDLYNGDREPKTVPWKYCSNRSLRIAASILDLLHSRFYRAIVNIDLLRWKTGSYLYRNKVERISKLMSWWIWVHNRMRSFFDRWIKVELGYGDSIVESSWKMFPYESNKEISEPIMGEDGNPIMNPDGTPAQMKSFKIEYDQSSESRIYLRDSFLLQENSTDIMRETVLFEEKIPYRDLEEGEVRGAFINVTNKLRNLISVTGLPDSEGTPEFEMLKDVKLRNETVDVVKAYIRFDANGDGFPEDLRVYIVPKYHLYLGGMHLLKITKSGKRPLTYTKLEDRIKNVEENWGIGILEKVRELANEIDALFNQMSDGNTLAVLTPGFYDPAGNIDAPALKISPNKWTPVPNPQQSVYIPTINVPTEKLINAIRLVLEFIERLTAASSYILGKESEIVGGSGTATRTNAIMQSAEQRFELPSERLREGAAKIINNHLDLLQLNIPQGLEEQILGENDEPIFTADELSEAGISGEYIAWLLPDPSFGNSDTERQIETMLYTILMQNPIFASDPVKIYQELARLLKTYGKDPVEYLGPEPDYDMIQDPHDENTLMLRGEFKQVRAMPTENHIEHIRVHQGLMQSPNFMRLAQEVPELINEITQFNQGHIQEHMQMLQMMMAMTQKLTGGKNAGQGNPAPADRGSGNSSPDERLAQSSGPLSEAMGRKGEGQSGMSQNQSTQQRGAMAGRG